MQTRGLVALMAAEFRSVESMNAKMAVCHGLMALPCRHCGGGGGRGERAGAVHRIPLHRQDLLCQGAPRGTGEPVLPLGRHFVVSAGLVAHCSDSSLCLGDLSPWHILLPHLMSWLVGREVLRFLVFLSQASFSICGVHFCRYIHICWINFSQFNCWIKG